jgi:hypothetical protein
MSNHHFKDKHLSMRAKGLLSMMLSLSDDWKFTLSGLVAMNREGITAVRAAVQELEDSGYLSRCRVRNVRGQMAETEYTVYEHPQPRIPIPKNPISDFPT